MNEVKKVMLLLEDPMSEDEIMALFNAADMDGDGRLNYKGYQSLYAKIESSGITEGSSITRV